MGSGEELHNLFGLMKFLNHAPYCDRGVWSSYISKPFRTAETSTEASQRLKEMLSQVMIKNREEDINHEISLPPCNVTSNFLTLWIH